ncbi:SET domain-containing protein RMS1 [Dothidotthia symphoricarpi CBS 119687]|uniref:SET domain-containing protein RMS1 n=1 Tax=Dothidotthia symphoricarpi CBS 119687 TaxID=1392245 RepID=A0A6A6AMB1_9PLEO|nr:SET domain-containing protein RMS1 [Dothidotthia symphoricarpi CBS 119687]KAF2132303.1 SET domain-containing protein RMS1 [Dothidotthia symphoricarpi CBS 119687]
MDEFQAATDRFLTWFKSVGGEFRDDLLEIRDLRSQNAGRGIVAIKDIPQDCTLFKIPRSVIINVQTSELAKKLPDVFNEEINDEDEDSQPLDSWGSLILVMLYEHLQGEASRWKPYFDVLPTTFDTPIFWSESDLKELEGTCLTTEKIGKHESDHMLRSRILPVVLQNPSVFFPKGAPLLSEDELLSLAHHIGSTIMAYAFDLENELEESDDEGEDGWVEDRDGKTMLGMVPMADMLNANADFNAHVNHGENLEVTALRADLKPGAEILNYYGPLPSSELLRRYGYVTPEHQRYDIVEIHWDLVQSTISRLLSLSVDTLDAIEEQQSEDEEECYHLIERDSGEPDEEGRLTKPAKLREVCPDLEDRLKQFLKALKTSNPKLIPDKRKRDELQNTVLREALMAKLAQYPTSTKEDKALLKSDGLSKRHRMAIEVRLGEKQLLEEAVSLVQETNMPQPIEGAERAAKKTKRG